MQVIQGLEEQIREEVQLPGWQLTVGKSLAKRHERHQKRMLHKTQKRRQGCCQLEVMDGLPDESLRHVSRPITLKVLGYLLLISSVPFTARVAEVDGDIPRVRREVP